MGEFAPGDRVLIAARNGTIRYGRIIEWFDWTKTWFVEIEPDPTLPNGAGYQTWYKPEALIKELSA